MQRIRLTFLNKALAIAAVLLVAANQAPVVEMATAGEIELSDAQNAKLARHKARERVSRNEANKDYSVGDDDASSSEEEECGTVDIGNVINNKGFGGPKKIDVIITGDIINANNDCD